MMLEGFYSGIRLRTLSVGEGKEDVLFISLLMHKSLISEFASRTLSEVHTPRRGRGGKALNL
jgi:hypothetical protein